MAEADDLYWQLIGRARFLRDNQLDLKTADLMDLAARRIDSFLGTGGGSTCNHRASVRSIDPDHLGNNFECRGCGARTPMPGFSPWTRDHLRSGASLQPVTFLRGSGSGIDLTPLRRHSSESTLRHVEIPDRSPFVTWGD